MLMRLPGSWPSVSDQFRTLGGEIRVTSATYLVDKTLAKALPGGGMGEGSLGEKSWGHRVLPPARDLWLVGPRAEEGHGGKGPAGLPRHWLGAA